MTFHFAIRTFNILPVVAHDFVDAYAAGVIAVAVAVVVVGVDVSRGKGPNVCEVLVEICHSFRLVNSLEAVGE